MPKQDNYWSEALPLPQTIRDPTKAANEVVFKNYAKICQYNRELRTENELNDRYGDNKILNSSTSTSKNHTRIVYNNYNSTIQCTPPLHHRYT